VNKTTLSLVGVCVVVVAAWVVPAARVASKPADAAEAVRWEYAELRVTTHPYWNSATTGEDEPKREVVLDVPDKAHKADTFTGLLLGRKVSQDNAAGVLNSLGQDGWEVVGFAATEWVNPGRAMKRVEAWTLKRAAKK
jgi:hypothetical protein